MSDEEKIKNFGDVVAAVQTLTKPIEEENIRLHEQIDKEKKDRRNERLGWIIAVVVLGIVLVAFMILAYATPVQVEQGQDFDGQTQSQSYSEGAASGG